MEGLLRGIADISDDGQATHEELSHVSLLSPEVRAQVECKLKLKTVNEKEKTVSFVDMKDCIFYAREEIRHAIDVLVKLETEQTPQPQPQTQPQPQQPNLIKLLLSAKPPPPSVSSIIESVRSALALTKMHLLNHATVLSTASSRLAQTLAHEHKFYHSVALHQLRKHNWILHPKDAPQGRALFVDYGLRNAGSMSPEICEAYFIWTSSGNIPKTLSGASNRDCNDSDSLVSNTNRTDKHKNKIQCRFGHGRRKIVVVSFNGGSSDCICSGDITYPNFHEYTKIQRALDAAKSAAFETEVFHEASKHAAITHRILPTPITITSNSLKFHHPSPPAATATLSVSSTSLESKPLLLEIKFSDHKPSPPATPKYTESDADAGFLALTLRVQTRRRHIENQARFLNIEGVREGGRLEPRRRQRRRHGGYSVVDGVVAWGLFWERVERVEEWVFRAGDAGGWRIEVERSVYGVDGVVWRVFEAGRCIASVYLTMALEVLFERGVGNGMLGKVRVKDGEILRELIKMEARFMENTENTI